MPSGNADNQVMVYGFCRWDAHASGGTIQAAANGVAQTPGSAFSNASGTMLVNEVASGHMLARMAAADTVVIGRNASESSDYLAALRAGAPEDDKG